MNITSRAKRGSTILKKVKTTNYEIIGAFITDSKDEVGYKVGDDITIIKNSEIPIMDLVSTGSVVTKKTISIPFAKKELYILKDEELLQIKEEAEDLIEELTIDDFIDDFKL